MTSKKSDPQRDVTGSSHEPSPWRVVDDGIGYVADSADQVWGFMSALRRFRARHGLHPTAQTPLLDDADLNDLRAHDDDDRPVPFADLPVNPDR